MMPRCESCGRSYDSLNINGMRVVVDPTVPPGEVRVHKSVPVPAKMTIWGRKERNPILWDLVWSRKK